MKPHIAAGIIEEIDYEFSRKNPPDWYPDLPRIPSERYLDADLFEQELAMFRESWVIVGTIHDFPETGSYKVVDHWNGASVVLVRGEDQKIRAFYNVCQHRGGPVATASCGIEKRLRCAVHSWTYSLDGRLESIPGQRDFHRNIDKDQIGLKGVRCSVWRGFVFICLGTRTHDLIDWLGPIAEEATWFDGLRVAGSDSMVLNCNWKVAIEANIEVYHVTTVHPDTVAKTLDYRGTAETLFRNGHSRMVVPSKGYNSNSVRLKAKDDPVNTLLENANVSYLLFPNHLTPGGLTPSGRPFMTLQSFWPISVDRTLAEWHIMTPDWGEGECPEQFLDATKAYSLVMEEDTAYLEEIQKALRSKTLDGFLTSYHERRLYHHEASIDRFIGMDRIAADLRMSQALPLVD
tara:strand:+ start:990 stop:2201 length:1212 start_codon:yes stop_codon:yes gene_type:complete